MLGWDLHWLELYLQEKQLQVEPSFPMVMHRGKFKESPVGLYTIHQVNQILDVLKDKIERDELSMQTFVELNFPGLALVKENGNFMLKYTVVE